MQLWLHLHRQRPKDGENYLGSPLQHATYFLEDKGEKVRSSYVSTRKNCNRWVFRPPQVYWFNLFLTLWNSVVVIHY